MIRAATRLNALGDPTRHVIFDLLSKLGPSSVADLASQVPVSRPAVSQHLKVLAEAGLVRHEVAGTRHLYQVDPAGVAALRDHFDNLWQRALTDFKAAAERSYRAAKEKKK